MRLIVDRIENGILICEKEDKSVITLNLNDYEITKAISEGDLIDIHANVIHVDYEGTSENKKDIDKVCKDMWDD